MESFYISNIALLCSTLLLFWWGWKIMNWAWFRPRKMENCLRKQGLNGNSYRLLFGDTKEMSMGLEEANSKPISLTNDIVPRIMPFFYETIKHKGKNSFIWLGTTPAVLLSDPEYIKEVMTKHYTFQKSRANPLTRLLAVGLIGLEKEKWAERRRLLNPAFRVEKLKLMLPAFHLSCDEMLREWKKVASAKGSCELDVLPFLQKLTSDAISRTAFGSNYEEGRKIFELIKEQVVYIHQVRQSIYIPGWRFLPTKRNKRMKKIAKEMNSLVLGLINNRVKEIQAGQATHNDLLGILLESNFNEILQHESKSLEDVIEECKTFYMVGQESTSMLLVWTLVLLGKHLDWQARARDEVLQVFGNSIPDINGLNRLKVVTMILNEVLRLYPPAPILNRTVYEETKLGELSLPAGVLLFLLPIFLQHDQDLWGDDVKEFNPERFRDGVSNATKGDRLSFIPFSWGPRVCIGQNFAMLEAKMTLALILQRFSFELSPVYTHAPQLTLTLQPRYGAQLILRKL